MSLIPALALVSALVAQTRFDAEGFPLPREAIRRLGSARFLIGGTGGSCVGYTADGRTLITCGPSIIAWDTTSGRARWTYSRPRTRFWNTVLGPDGKTVWAIAYPHSERGTVRTAHVIRLSTADGTRLAETELGQVQVADLSPTGRVVTTLANHQVSLLDGATGKPLGTWGVPPASYSYVDILRVRLAPDNRSVAVGTTVRDRNNQLDSRVRVVDLVTGNVKREIVTKPPFERAIFTLHFAPDGRRLYALLAPGQWSNNNVPDSVLCAWDLRSGATRLTVPVKSDVGNGTLESANTFAVSPDGKLAAVGGPTRPTWVYDLSTGKIRCRIPARFGYLPVFDPTGKTLAIGGYSITQWDTATGKLRPHSPSPYPTGWLSYSADGRRLGVDSYGYSDSIAWDVRTGREVSRVSWVDPGHHVWLGRGAGVNPYTRPLTVRSPDGSLSAHFVAHRGNFQHPDNGKIVLTDPRTGRKLRTLPAVSNSTSGLVFSADGRFLISDNDNLVSVYDTAAGKVAYQLKFSRLPGVGYAGPVGGRLVPSPDGRHLAILKGNPTWPTFSRWTVGVYDLPSGKEVREYNGTGRLNALSWSADSARLAGVTTNDPSLDESPGVLFVGDVTAERQPLPVTRVDIGGRAAALSPDGRTLATPAGGTIRMWEVATGKVRYTFVGLGFAASDLAFAPDGRALAALSADGPVLLWDARGEMTRAKAPPDGAALDRAWDALAGDDAERAYRAIRLLAHAPAQALPFLKRKLKAVPTPKPERIAALVQRLDSPSFAERERAEAELRQLFESAAPALRKALTESRSAEVRQRAERVLKASAAMTPQRLRTIRAIEAVEWVGGPDAVELLERITYGSAEARAALARLRR